MTNTRSVSCDIQTPRCKVSNTRRSVSSDIQMYETPLVFSPCIVNQFENKFLTFSILFDLSWFTDLFDG